MDSAAEQLREIALERDEGALIGSEDDLIAMLGVSRVTVRQVARLLEYEGLLRVRRGTNGGYFASRPDAPMVEATVIAYLNTLGLKPGHVGVVGSALWIETLREAASLGTPEAVAVADQLRERLAGIGEDATMVDVGKYERESRSAIFALIDGQYIELIFRINAAFAVQRLRGNTDQLDPAIHREFVRHWLKAKAMEIDAIADADPLLAMMAARHSRNIWDARRHGRYQAWRSA